MAKKKRDSSKVNYRTLAAKVFPGWEGELVFAPKSMAGLCRTYPDKTPVQLVLLAGSEGGLGASDVAQEFGGTLGK